MSDREAPITILLVDDNEDDHLLVNDLLKKGMRQKFSVEFAATHEQAVAHFNHTQHDIYLFDYWLFEVDGIQLLESAKACGVENPIIFLTGRRDEAAAVAALKAGATDYLRKDNLTSELLCKAIDHALELRQLQELRKQAESALIESERRFRLIIEQASDVVYTMNLDGQFTYVNPLAEKLTGFSTEKLLTMHFTDLLPEGWWQRLVTSFYERQLQDDIHETLLEFPIATASGEQKWGEQRVTLLHQGDKPVGFQAIVRDVSERKLAEDAEREQRILALALRDTAAVLTGTLDLDEVLDRILTNVGYVVPHGGATIMLLEEKTGRIVRYRGHGSSDIEESLLAHLLPIIDVPYLRHMEDNKQPIAIPDTQLDPMWVDIPELLWIRSYVGAPVRMHGKVIGFINLYNISPGFFSPMHAERLEIFADQAAVAIQNAKLYEQAQELAAVEERQRLARELHDSVSQTIFSANIIAQSLTLLYDRDPDEVRSGLKEIAVLTKGAQAEMRTLLNELRPSSLIEANLSDLLQQLVDSISSRTHVVADINALDDLSLPPDVQLAFYRIAQETLNNITKHAHAGEVMLKLRDKSDLIELRIIDNGRGFERNKIDAAKYGLDIIAERAASIGATLTIDSHVGMGTEVTVVWAREQQLVDNEA